MTGFFMTLNHQNSTLEEVILCPNDILAKSFGGKFSKYLDFFPLNNQI